MRKRFLVTTLITVLLALALLTMALRSERFVLASLEWTVDTFTDLDIEFTNPRIDLLKRHASAQEIHFYQDTATGPALVSILNLEAELNLADLLSSNLQRTRLSAGAVMIFIAKGDAVEDPQPVTWLGQLGWLPDRLEIGSVHLINQAEDVWIFPMKNVLGRRAGDSSYLASAEADYEGEPLGIRAELLAIREGSAFTGVELRADIDAPLSNSKVSLAGEVRGTLEDYSYHGSINARYQKVEDFLRGFTRSERRLSGSLLIEGEISGDSRSCTVQARSVVLDNMPAYGFEASGELSYDFATGASDMRAVTAGEIASLEVLGNALGVDFSGFDRAVASANISGSLEQPRIDQFTLITSNRSGFNVKMSGRLSREELRMGTASPDNELFVDINGDSVANLEQWTGGLPFEPGPWAASARLTRTASGLAVDRLLVELGTPDSVQLRLAGGISEINLSSTPATRQNVSGIDVVLSGSTDNAALVGEWLAIPLPPYHAIDASVQLRGDGGLLEARNGQVVVRGSDAEARLDEVSLDIVVAEQPQIRNFSAALTAELSDTSAISQYSTQAAISLGPVSASARLIQEASRFAARDVRIQVEGPELALDSTGQIDDLGSLSGVTLVNRFSGIQTREALATWLEDFSYPTSIGSLQGDFTLTRPADSWMLKALTVENTGSEVLSFALQGKQIDLSDLSADLRASYSISDTDLLEALLGLRVAPTMGTLTARTQAGQLAIDAALQAGGTTINANAEISGEDKEITGLKLRLQSPHLHLNDLGLQATSGTGDAYRPAAQLQPALDRQTEQLTSRAPAYPTQIRLDIEQISGLNSSIDSLSLELTGRDKAYTLREFNLTYASGSAEARGIIDLNPDPIAISLAGLGIAIPLNQLSTDLGIETDIQGTLSFRGGVTARDVEPTALLDSLAGSVAFALEDATIEGAAYDVLATGILEWMYSGAALEKSTRIDCTMARFDIAGGVARSEDIFVETRNMIATGEARIDLTREELDLTLVPRSKSRAIQIPSNIRIRGPFSKPRTIVSPITATADAYAEAVLLIPNLALKLFGIEKRAPRSSRPCEASVN